VTAPPRKGFIRAILEDESGTVVLCRISEERFLLVAADVDVKLGAVSMSVSRLADSLAKE
jgi:predicted regulator of Ras-like GTPase activity (Roadblock/LC7/MglB family)